MKPHLENLNPKIQSYVHGAALRVSLPYEDPKSADGTPAEAATYDERGRQIATEMFYLFSEVRG